MSKAIDKIQPDYEERSQQQIVKGRKILIIQAKREWASIQKDKDGMNKMAVSMVNRVSKLGGIMLQIVGGDQLGFSFWNEHCKSQLPKEFNFEVAKQMIAIHKKFPEPIKTIAEVYPIWKQTLICLGEMEVQNRLEDQTPSDVSPLVEYTNLLRKSVTTFEKWTQQNPMEKWNKEALQTFVVETTPVSNLHDEAEQLLKKQVS